MGPVLSHWDAASHLPRGTGGTKFGGISHSAFENVGRMDATKPQVVPPTGRKREGFMSRDWARLYAPTASVHNELRALGHSRLSQCLTPRGTTRTGMQHAAMHCSVHTRATCHAAAHTHTHTHIHMGAVQHATQHATNEIAMTFYLVFSCRKNTVYSHCEQRNTRNTQDIRNGKNFATARAL